MIVKSFIFYPPNTFNFSSPKPAGTNLLAPFEFGSIKSAHFNGTDEADSSKNYRWKDPMQDSGQENSPETSSIDRFSRGEETASIPPWHRCPPRDSEISKEH
jgi:hypothetical protein